MKYLIAIFSFFNLLEMNAQQFIWSESGYVNSSGGGFFSNIDGNGTDLTVSGFIDDIAIESSGCIASGIDDQGHEAMQHVYSFSFSQPVSLWFDISELNSSSSTVDCYNDQLTFNGTPIFNYSSAVTISGNVVTPTSFYPSNGTITVSYYDVQNITIVHGDGIECNPGHIFICALNFGVLSTDEIFEKSNLLVYPNPVDNVINLNFTKNDDSEKAVRIYNLVGKIVYSQTIHKSSQIYLSDLSSGSYILEVMMGDRKVLKNIQVN